MNTHAISVDGNIADPNTGNAISNRFLSYVALLTQQGTNAPVATVLNSGDYNYLGDITWTYSDVGYYIGTKIGLMPQNKTFLNLASAGTLMRNAVGVEENPDSIYVVSALDGVPADGALNNTAIEVRVYQA